MLSDQSPGDQYAAVIIRPVINRPVIKCPVMKSRRTKMKSFRKLSDLSEFLMPPPLNESILSKNLTVVVWWSYSSSRCSLGLSMSGVFCRRSWWVCRGTWPMPFPTTDDRREIFRLISTNSSMPSKAYRANWGPPDHTLSRLGELTHLVNQFIN